MLLITHAPSFIEALKWAIDQADKARILELYDLNGVDWDVEPMFVAAEYDHLVDIANNILGI